MGKYIISCEHCGGGSVDHPCTDGIYEDPSHDLDGIEIDAQSAHEAIQLALADLVEKVNMIDYCKCNRKMLPGTDMWWDSVMVDARPVR